MEFGLTDKQIKDVVRRVKEGTYIIHGLVCPDIDVAVAHEAQKELVKHLEGKFRKVTGGLIKPYRFIDEDEWQSILKHFELEDE